MSTLSDREAQVEALLFVASKPLSIKTLSELLHCSQDEIVTEVVALQALYTQQQRGIQLLRQGLSAQMVSHPRFGQLVGALYRDELSGDLTRPALETLTIIAYRGPIRKSELDQIRGVNCSLILRNLMLRGLVEQNQQEDGVVGERWYTITMDCLRHLGLATVEDLPEYSSLHSHEKITSLLDQAV